MLARRTIPRGFAGLFLLLGMGCSSDQSDVEYPLTVPEALPVVTAPAALTQHRRTRRQIVGHGVAPEVA